jgi:signal transduction histidine kinase
VQATSAPITFARGPGLAGWVMRNRAAACLPDVRKDPRWLQEDGRAEGVRSVAAVPLTTKDETLGVLLLSSPQINYFSPAQLQLISTIANEIAIAIHNAELYSFITDQSLRVSELLEYQRRETGKSQAILQSVTEGVIMIDEQQQVVLFNPAAEELLHIPALFMLQQPLTRLCEYGETAEAAARAVLIYAGLQAGLRALGEGEISSHSLILELPAPAQFIVLSFADVLQPFGSPYGCVIVLSDITDEIESDRAKSDFVSSIVRELRDPLTSIKGYADLFLLGKAGQLSAEQLAFVQIIKNNANRLTELNNAIAMIGSIDSGKIREGSSIERIDLAAIIAQLCQAMRAEIEQRSLTLQADLAHDMPAISADLGHIIQIIQALLSNAIKFSYPGGAITVRASQIESAIQIDIADTGVGIAPEQQQALFRRFYRADNPLRGELGGAGLGLAITKALVELYGGTIWVSSAAGKGSTFSFTLPITAPGISGDR